MYPLLFASLLASTVILERLFFLGGVRRNRDPKAVQSIMSNIEAGNVDGAIRAGHGTKDFVARTLVYALAHREKSLSNALMRSSAQELVRFERGISILDTVITMSPLLGLLGTVTGMMGSFGMLGGAELSAPAQITGGIAEALIATAFGLGIAITCLVPLNYLHSKSEDARHEMEDAATHLELLMKPIMESEARQANTPFQSKFSEGVMANAAMVFPPGNSLKDYA
jgi:biopolymer transport protein ExbB